MPHRRSDAVKWRWKPVLASVRTTVLPEFSVDVYPAYDDDHVAHQRYVLVLRDGTLGAVELVFPSGQDLRAFLTLTREAYLAARQEAIARKAKLRQARLRQPKPKANQTTLF